MKNKKENQKRGGKGRTSKLQKTTKVTKGKPSKTAKNTPKKARERVTVSNYQRLAMRTCLPQCKCWEYAIPELVSEWHEALSKIEGTRAKIVRMDANPMPSKSQEWLDGKRNEIKEELGDIFWSLALVCEFRKESFADAFRNTKPTDVDGLQIPFWFFPEGSVDDLLFAPVKTQICALKRICQCLMIKASDCLEANIRKLSKRQAENKIQGDGDKR